MKQPNTRIALVDDHALLRDGLASLIANFDGFEVSMQADNGRDFIDQLKPANKPDIVLLDITMPLMNGFETAAWIKEHQPDIRVLVLSMMDNDTAIITMLKSGARGYVLKDSKPGVFRQALTDIRDKGFFMNDLISNKMLTHITSDPPAEMMVSQLTEKELTVLKLACSELTYKEIAAEMGLSPRTVEGYRDELFRKLKIQSRVGLVMFAMKQGLIKL